MKQYTKPTVQVISLQCSSIMQTSGAYNKKKTFEEEEDVAMLITHPAMTMA